MVLEYAVTCLVGMLFTFTATKILRVGNTLHEYISKNCAKRGIPQFAGEAAGCWDTANVLKEMLISFPFSPYNLKIASPHPIF